MYSMELIYCYSPPSTGSAVYRHCQLGPITRETKRDAITVVIPETAKMDGLDFLPCLINLRRLVIKGRVIMTYIPRSLEYLHCPMTDVDLFSCPNLKSIKCDSKAVRRTP